MSTKTNTGKYAMDNEAIARELKAACVYRTENRGAVRRIAEGMNLTESTIYDYLDGRIKASLPFLLAATVATDGDPDVKKFLEPPGWTLVKAEACPQTDDFEHELGDVDIAVSAIRAKVRRAQEDGRIDNGERANIRRAIENARVELNELDVLLNRI